MRLVQSLICCVTSGKFLRVSGLFNLSVYWERGRVEKCGFCDVGLGFLGQRLQGKGCSVPKVGPNPWRLGVKRQGHWGPVLPALGGVTLAKSPDPPRTLEVGPHCRIQLSAPIFNPGTSPHPHSFPTYPGSAALPPMKPYRSARRYGPGPLSSESDPKELESSCSSQACTKSSPRAWAMVPQTLDATKRLQDGRTSERGSSWPGLPCNQSSASGPGCGVGGRRFQDISTSPLCPHFYWWEGVRP